MKRFYKHEAADTGLGQGMAYFEFEDEWAMRQIEVYGEHWLSSIEEYHPGIGPGLIDQPLPVLGFGPEDEISKEEFEALWTEALKRHNRTNQPSA